MDTKNITFSVVDYGIMEVDHYSQTTEVLKNL